MILKLTVGNKASSDVKFSGDSKIARLSAAYLHSAMGSKASVSVRLGLVCENFFQLAKKCLTTQL
jgi:hypothetical protein